MLIKRIKRKIIDFLPGNVSMNVSIWWLFCVHALWYIYQQTMNLEVLRICSGISVLVTSSTHSNCRVLFYTITFKNHKNVTRWLPLKVQPRSCGSVIKSLHVSNAWAWFHALHSKIAANGTTSVNFGRRHEFSYNFN